MAAGLQIHAQIDSTRAIERLDELRTKKVPDYRRQLTRVVMREVLKRTTIYNPVDTGRSRAAWVTALKQLGGVPPPRYPGRSPIFIAEGNELASVSESNATTKSELNVTNGVLYVPLLEFGTKRHTAYRMVERSLREVKHNLRNLVHSL